MSDSPDNATRSSDSFYILFCPVCREVLDEGPGNGPPAQTSNHNGCENRELKWVSWKSSVPREMAMKFMSSLYKEAQK